MMSKKKFTKCSGDGLGSCSRCTSKGIWNKTWMCFLYTIDNVPGVYCRECCDEILAELSNKEVKVYK